MKLDTIELNKKNNIAIIKLTIYCKYVDDNLGSLVRDTDLSKFIL